MTRMENLAVYLQKDWEKLCNSGKRETYKEHLNFFSWEQLEEIDLSVVVPL
jgi:hypothetical protein